MAHGRQEFALVGYSEDLERKPLKFVDAIPAARICSACSNVPRLTYYLLCGHTLCDPCYKSCATTSDCVCPLDRDVCVTADVSSKEYPAENLLRRKVLCWNEANGCPVILPASQIADHVRHDCQYHVTRCPTCSAAVLSRDVCGHLKSQCTVLVLHAAPEAHPRADGREMTQFVAFEREVKQQVRELDARLAQLYLESRSHNDKLVDVCQNINHLKEAQAEQFEAQTRQFEQASDQTFNLFVRNGAEMKALVAQETTIEQRVSDLNAKLAQLSLEIASQRDKLELFRNENQLKETLTKQFGTASIQTLDRLDRNVAELKALVETDTTTEQRVGELDTKLAKLTLLTSSLSDKLIEICRENIHLKEVLAKEFGTCLDRHTTDMKALYSEKTESLRTALTSVLASVPSDRKTHQRVMTGYETLKRDAVKDGWSRSMSDRVYMQRYLMSWGIEFRKEGDSVYFGLCVQVHEGREDDFLDWPFTKNMKICIIHPETRQERNLDATLNPCEAYKRDYSRPIKRSNRPIFFLATRVESTDIERDGYVERDQLLLRFEVLM